MGGGGGGVNRKSKDLRVDTYAMTEQKITSWNETYSTGFSQVNKITFPIFSRHEVMYLPCFGICTIPRGIANLYLLQLQSIEFKTRCMLRRKRLTKVLHSRLDFIIIRSEKLMYNKKLLCMHLYTLPCILFCHVVLKNFTIGQHEHYVKMPKQQFCWPSGEFYVQ